MTKDLELKTDLVETIKIEEDNTGAASSEPRASLAQITREGDVGKVKRLLDLIGSGQGGRTLIDKLDESKVMNAPGTKLMCYYTDIKFVSFC